MLFRSGVVLVIIIIIIITVIVVPFETFIYRNFIIIINTIIIIIRVGLQLIYLRVTICLVLPLPFPLLDGTPVIIRRSCRIIYICRRGKRITRVIVIIIIVVIRGRFATLIRVLVSRYYLIVQIGKRLLYLLMALLLNGSGHCVIRGHVEVLFRRVTVVDGHEDVGFLVIV